MSKLHDLDDGFSTFPPRFASMFCIKKQAPLHQLETMAQTKEVEGDSRSHMSAEDEMMFRLGRPFEDVSGDRSCTIIGSGSMFLPRAGDLA